MAKKYYIISGEASGDLHGSNLMKEMLHLESDLDIRFWGGDKMTAVGGTRVKHIRDLAFMGFVEVLMNLRTILSNLDFCKKDIEAFQPDAIILIDYPGFNLRIAEWAKSKGIKVIYYISPQIWAWKQKRVFKIKKCVDEMYVILPFEKDFYKKFDYEVHYEGNPLLDAIEDYQNQKISGDEFRSKYELNERPIIALLPGSRKQEISKLLPVMLEAIEPYSDQYQVLIAGAPNMPLEYYQTFFKSYKPTILSGVTYDIISNAEAALVTSGTATLETALLKTPEIVCYVGSKISIEIAKRLIKIKYISLVNLIMDRLVVTELIQNDCNPTRIRKELSLILEGGDKRFSMLTDYDELQRKLGGSGVSKRIAQLLLKRNH